VVGVVVGVDEVGDRAGHAVGGGDLVDGQAQVGPMLGGASNTTTPSWWSGTPLVDAVGDPVQVPLHAPDVVPVIVEGRRARTGIGA